MEKSRWEWKMGQLKLAPGLLVMVGLGKLVELEELEVQSK